MSETNPDKLNEYDRYHSAMYESNWSKFYPKAILYDNSDYQLTNDSLSYVFHPL